MAKRWTQKEDAFILQFHPIGVSFIGPHDLGRSAKATRARFDHLTKSGAREAFARMMLAELDYSERAGFIRAEDAAHERQHWDAELAECLALEAE